MTNHSPTLRTTTGAALPVTHDPDTAGWQFASGRLALAWSTEVLRRRRLPKLSTLWREAGGHEVPHLLESWEAELMSEAPWRYLPTQADDRYSLALDVAKVLADMGETGQILHLQAWGDWSTDARLRQALAFQEKMRREGVRVLINYRYTFRQLAEMLGTSEATVWRRSRDALRTLEDGLRRKGLLWMPGA